MGFSELNCREITTAINPWMIPIENHKNILHIILKYYGPVIKTFRTYSKKHQQYKAATNKKTI
jgi:hypothetical protein